MMKNKGTEMLKDLIDSKAIYWFAAGLALVVVSLVIDYANFTECRNHGFSLLFCFSI